MSFFDLTPHEKADLEHRLQRLRASTLNGANITPAQALDERIARGDEQALHLKRLLATFTSVATAAATSEEPAHISRATTLHISKPTFGPATVTTGKAHFRARNSD